MEDSTSVPDTRNGTWNTSLEQYLLDHLGPRSKDLVSAVILTVVYSLIFLSGLIGNICTCVVIARNHCMQTTTNYYLFSLAVSDLLLLFFGLPPELYTIWEAYPWRLGETFCYLRQTILELTSYASVLTITAFTVERYLAICKPLVAHKIAVLSRAVKIIVAIWVVSLLAALPYAVHTRLFHSLLWPPTSTPLDDSLVCSIPSKWLEGRMTYMFQISTFLFFLAPVTLIICLYIMIGIALRTSPLARGASDDSNHTNVKHATLPYQPRRAVVRMLVAVTVAFIICWAPFHTQRLMVLYVSLWTPELLAVQSHIFYVSGVLYFVSSTVNPILYNLMSRRYRAAFRQTIFGPFRRTRRESSRPRLGSNTTYRQAVHGDSNFNQQRHCFLAKHIRAHHHHLHLQHHHQQQQRPGSGDLCSARTESFALKTSVRNKQSPPLDWMPSPAAELLSSTLCPNILACRKSCLDKSCQKPQRPHAAGIALGSLDDDDASGTGDAHKPQKSDDAGDGDTCVHNGLPRETLPGTRETLRAANRSSTLHSLDAEDDGRPRASYQEGVSGAQDAPGLCKQCLTHSANGNPPQYGVIAYHVRVNMNEPRTVV